VAVEGGRRSVGMRVDESVVALSQTLPLREADLDGGRMGGALGADSMAPAAIPAARPKRVAASVVAVETLPRRKNGEECGVAPSETLPRRETAGDTLRRPFSVSSAWPNGHVITCSISTPRVTSREGGGQRGVPWGATAHA
jgi:hypothetical protein